VQAVGRPAEGQNGPIYNNTYDEQPAQPLETETAPAESSTEVMEMKEVT
jgi:hypothetical protein